MKELIYRYSLKIQKKVNKKKNSEIADEWQWLKQ